jgi:ubiquitin C-terminal hydrolase
VLAASEPLHNFLSETSEHTTPEGQLTTPFVSLMRNIYRSQSSQPLDPKELYNIFVKKYTYFKPYTQQDAHEFMRFLLEGLKSEVSPPPVPDAIVRPTMKRTRRRTLVPAGTEEIENPDRNASNQTQGTYIDQLFGGKLASYVICDVCKSVILPIVMADDRYRQATRIFRTFHCPFMMQILLICENAIDFARNSSVQMPSTHSIHINTLSQCQLYK